jgi:predicted transcriptional regulator
MIDDEPVDGAEEPTTGTSEDLRAREGIAFLVGSDTRIEIIRSLQSGARRPTELAARCGCARETAQRTLGAFVERGWAEKVSTEEGYQLTPAGKLVADGYDRFESRVATSDRLSPLLRNLRGVDVVSELDHDTLEGLTHAQSTAGNPHAPLERFLTVVGDEPVGEFRGITPIVSGIFNQAVAEVIDGDSRIELVVDEDALTMSVEEFPEAFERAERLDGFSLYVSDEPVTFGVMLADEHAYLGAYDDGDNLVASADGTDEAFVAWVEETFERVKDHALEWDI